ncbi:MAG: ABC transporter substrate-binding protein [Phycisphaerae bacterium]
MTDSGTRWIRGIACVVLVACCGLVASCAKEESQSGGQGKALKTGKIVMGFSQIGSESDWRAANTVSIKAEAEKRGFDLRFADAQQKQENQIKALRSFIAQQVDIIAFSPVVETGWEPVLREISKAGIPVILTDRGVDVTDHSLYVTFIGSDFIEEGRRAAKWFVDNTTGDVKVFELRGTPGASCAIDRKKGFEEAIAKEPRIKIVKSQDGNFERGRGKEVMEAFIKTKEGKAFNALFAHNDDMALGAIQAMKEAGLKPGVDIKIVSIDAVKAAFEAMIAGELNCTVECNPLIGPQLLDLVEALIKKRLVIKEGVYDQSVAKDLIGSRKY